MNDHELFDSLIDETARRRFEECWLDGHPEPIDSFLPAEEDARYLPTLEELVQIELEFAWQAFASDSRHVNDADATLLQAPVVELYLQRFPQLAEPAILTRLIEQEVRVRGDVRQAASVEDYRHRFPQLVLPGGPFESKLKALTADRAAMHGDAVPGSGGSSSRSGQLPGGAGGALPRCFGNYELLEELGRGGMGVVYRARQSGADRIVAVKVIRRDWLEAMPAEARASALDRFRHEAQAAARIEHEHIVRVYDVGAVEGEPFFSMQFVDGESLAERVRGGPLDGRLAATLLEPVARAVDEAHRRGILHRDLKPQNILVDRASEAALVADFGLAKLVQAGDDLTRAGDVMGSPPYMSPEQAHDSSLVTTQSDVYALGATLYHTLAGQPPFHADTVLDTLSKVVHEEPVPPRQINPTIDLDLQTICLKCLQKEPARRYVSAASLADDLQCYLTGAPISARPVSTLERCWLWCRRNPLVASLTGSTAVFLLLALVASVVGYFQTSAALSTAEQRHRETRQVLNDFFTRVSEDRLLNEPGMQPLRQELLHGVLPYYRRFLVEFADDPAIRDELALTHFRIGLITEEIESPQDALPWYLTARNMQQELLAGQPDDAGSLRDLGNTLTALGRVLQRQARHDEAREAFQQAIEIRARLVRSQPADREAQRMLANSYMNLGLLEKDVGDLDAAIGPYDQAQDIRRRILQDDPRNEMVRRDLAMGSYNLAVLAADNVSRVPESADAHLHESRQHLRHAADLFEVLLQDNPGDLANQYRLVLCYRMLADLETDLSTALELYTRAIDGMKQLAFRNPDVPVYQADLAVLYLTMGRRNAESGHATLAREQLDVARRGLEELALKHPSVARYRYDLAATLHELAVLCCESGEVLAAREYLQSAQDYLRQLVKESPDNTQWAAKAAEVERMHQVLLPKPTPQDPSSGN